MKRHPRSRARGAAAAPAPGVPAREMLGPAAAPRSRAGVRAAAAAPRTARGGHSRAGPVPGPQLAGLEAAARSAAPPPLRCPRPPFLGQEPLRPLPAERSGLRGGSSPRSLLLGPGRGQDRAVPPAAAAPPVPQSAGTAGTAAPLGGGSTLGRAGVRGAGGDTRDRGCAHAAAAGGGRRGSAAAGDQLRPAPPRRGPPAPWGTAPAPPAPPALPALPARRPPGPPRGGWRPPSPELPCSLLLLLLSYFSSSRGHSPV